MNSSTQTRKVVFLALIALVTVAVGLLLLDVLMSGKLSRRLLYQGHRTGRPSVLMVVVDTLRADRLSQYGHPVATSPALDRLTSQATVFERAYGTSSWTIPSTTSLLTSLHPARHKAVEQGATLNPDIVTIAELLKKAGYATAGFSYNIHITNKHGYNQGFDTFLDYDGDVMAYPDISEMIGSAHDWLEGYDERKPFFMYLQPMNCHGPYKVPEAHRRDLFKRGPAKGFKYYGAIMRDIMWKGKVERRKDVTKPYLKSLGQQYDASVRYSTDQVARLFDTLIRKGLWDNTLVIFTADHGEELFEHGGFAHAYTLYEEVIHVPMIVKLPKQRESARSDAFVSLMDLYPTITDIMNIPIEHRIDGLSLMPVLGASMGKREKKGDRERFDDRELLLHLAWKGRGLMKGLYDGRRKYIDLKHDYTKTKNKKYLFDLASDPAELDNRLPAEEKRAEKMHKDMTAMWKAYSNIAFDAPKNVLNEMNVEALKALGYIH